MQELHTVSLERELKTAEGIYMLVSFSLSMCCSDWKSTIQTSLNNITSLGERLLCVSVMSPLFAAVTTRTPGFVDFCVKSPSHAITVGLAFLMALKVDG